jgi:hypothetical protein
MRDARKTYNIALDYVSSHQLHRYQPNMNWSVRFEKVRDIINLMNVMNVNQEFYWFDFGVLGFVIPSKTRQSHKMSDVNPRVHRQYVDFK